MIEGKCGAEGEDYLEQEKRNDPVERQEQLIKRAEAMMNRALERGEVAVKTYHPPAPTSITLTVRKISNGYILSRIPEGVGGYVQPGEHTHFKETFFKTSAELVAEASLQIEEFTGGLGYECPVGPPGQAGSPGDHPGGEAVCSSDPTPDVPEGT